MDYFSNDDDRIRFSQLLQNIPEDSRSITKTYVDLKTYSRTFCFNNGYKIVFYYRKNDVDKSSVSHWDYPIIFLSCLCSIQTFLTFTSPPVAVVADVDDAS